MNDLAAIHKLDLDLRGIVKLHGGTFGRVENGVNIVPSVDNRWCNPFLRWSWIVATNLSFACADEVGPRRSVRFWSRLPSSPARQRHNRAPQPAASCLPPDAARRSRRSRIDGAVSRISFQRRAGTARNPSCQHRCQDNSQLRFSLPTPPLNFVSHDHARRHRDCGAVAIAGSCASAMPRLMRASTVLLPWASVEVKVTMVPSGTGLPEQSRIGSVRTRMPFLLGSALMRMLQGSEATCCTTRRTETRYRWRQRTGPGPPSSTNPAW